MSADLLGEAIRVTKHGLKMAPLGASDNIHGFVVCETPLGSNKSGEKAGLKDLSVVRESEFNALREAVGVRVERAEAIAQAAWEHRDYPFHKIGRISSEACFPVELGIWPHIMGNISDMNPELPSLSSDPLKGKGVIKIQSRGRVDTDDRIMTAVFAASSILLFNVRAEFIGFAEDFRWKRFAEGGSRLIAGLGFHGSYGI